MPVDADNIDELKDSVNAASGQVRALWITFTSLIAYLAIAAGSVTHRMLFEETPIKLPILGVDLPLVGFFVIAPFFFVIFHFYLLLQTLMLVRIAAQYNETLLSLSNDPVARQKMRRRLDIFVIVQLVAGARDGRSGLNAWLLKAVATITLLILPIAILLQIDLVFLPYHNGWVTWFHRLLLAFDLAMLWVFWPVIQETEAQVRFRRPSLKALAPYGSVLVMLFAVFVATSPGEAMHRLVGHIYPVSDALFGGTVGGAKGTPDRLFSNVLIIADQKFTDDEKIDKVERTVSLRGRDLRGAILLRVDLRKADFTGANLTSAVFDYSRLSEARFGCAEKPDVNAADKSIFGKLHTLDENPPVGWPQDWCTWLPGASFVGAQLQGADFEKARLQSALFSAAQMQGARLDSAELQGASFFGANLDGASLEFARLYATSLHSSSLRGASLANAQLQGASLFNVNLDGAALSGAAIGSGKPAAPTDPEISLVYQWPRSVRYADFSDLDPSNPFFGDKTFEQWREDQVAGLPAGIASHMRERLKALTPGADDLRFLVTAKQWQDAQAKPVTGADFEAPFATFVIALACKTAQARFIAPGLVRNQRLGAAGGKTADVVAALKDPKTCMGSSSLTPSDLAKLEQLPALSSPAKP